MRDIGEMDMLGFLKIRAWDARREFDKAHITPGKVYIDAVWPMDAISL